MDRMDAIASNKTIEKVIWLQSEDDEPAVKISSIIAVLSLTMQP